MKRRMTIAVLLATSLLAGTVTGASASERAVVHVPRLAERTVYVQVTHLLVKVSRLELGASHSSSNLRTHERTWVAFETALVSARTILKSIPPSGASLRRVYVILLRLDRVLSVAARTHVQTWHHPRRLNRHRAESQPGASALAGAGSDSQGETN